ncbi:MAM and LDL-receptor class A domain-containing protein 2 [Liparis tanakae]|uniref:MAM and LDL-receptor class A domain-containing protein 2 n=1 Tax=Liparis tanakae TaxID=230148 RepID=A0A4Z2GQ24_9TELE|nr:MAM and LDL-receptor class A domain-containing protein 2 [Liparis tanakae]
MASTPSLNDQLLIKAENNDFGFIAIDDVSVTPGLCQVNETNSVFVDCTFENGTCGWEDISSGPCQWTRGRNNTGNTGPSVDNTVGTELGMDTHTNPSCSALIHLHLDGFTALRAH